MSFWDRPLQSRYSVFDDTHSFSEAMDEMFDMTFPPSRYRSSKSQDQYRQSTPQQQVRSPDKKLVIARLDVSHYKPEEVTCKVENGKVLVSGKHYSENEYGYDASEFHRSYSLLEGVIPQSVKSRISQDGMLQIEAFKEQPKPLALEEVAGIDETDDTKISLKINLGGYKPEEVNVRVKGNELMVSAEQKLEEEGHVTHREFKRKFSLPSGVDISTLVSRFSKDGTLRIEAQKEVPAIEEKHIEIEQDEKLEGEN